MKVAISGGCGFIGHHVVEHLLKNTDWEIIVLDKLNYASNGFDRLRDIKAFDNRRVKVHACNLDLPVTIGLKAEVGEFDYFLHLAAETHVDNSIEDPWPFIQANVIGTYNMLQWMRQIKSLKKVLYFSTDEVFGPAWSRGTPEPFDRNRRFLSLKMAYHEWDRYNSGNPYSATKAAGEELCLAWANTYKVPVLITHTMNAFGERQHPEKFIPKVVRSLLTNQKVFIHANKDKTEAGSRFYIHCRNIADAILFLLNDKVSSATDKYNIVGEKEIDNLSLAKLIARILNKDLDYELVDFHSSRPGHDLRYSLDGFKMAAIGWMPGKHFEDSLQRTIEWMVAKENLKWLNL